MTTHIAFIRLRATDTHAAGDLHIIGLHSPDVLPDTAVTICRLGLASDKTEIRAHAGTSRVCGVCLDRITTITSLADPYRRPTRLS